MKRYDGEDGSLVGTETAQGKNEAIKEMMNSRVKFKPNQFLRRFYLMRAKRTTYLFKFLSYFIICIFFLNITSAASNRLKFSNMCSGRYNGCTYRS